MTYPGPNTSQRLLSRCAQDVRQRAAVNDQLRRVHHPGPPVAATLLSCVDQERPSDLEMHAVLVLGTDELTVSQQNRRGRSVVKPGVPAKGAGLWWLRGSYWLRSFSARTSRRALAASGESSLQISRLSGCRMSLQAMAMLMAVSCLSPVITHTCTQGGTYSLALRAGLPGDA